MTHSAAHPPAVRILADCPHCGKRLAPDWCGLWTRHSGPRRRCETHVAYCPLCDCVWIVRATRWRGEWTWFYTPPRKATAIEKRMALKHLFTRRGAAVPAD